MSASVIPNEVAIFNEETDELFADSNETEKGTFDQIIEANESELMQIFSTMFIALIIKQSTLSHSLRVLVSQLRKFITLQLLL